MKAPLGDILDSMLAICCRKPVTFGVDPNITGHDAIKEVCFYLPDDKNFTGDYQNWKKGYSYHIPTDTLKKFDSLRTEIKKLKKTNRQP